MASRVYFCKLKINYFHRIPLNESVDTVRLISLSSYAPRVNGVRYASTAASKEKEPITIDGEEFRVLVIPGHTKVPEVKREARFQRREVPPPRYKGMKPDQDWTNVWPSAHTFKWSVVPFPIRQGYVEKSENDGMPPSKYANAELMKIPNFLHLTPSHVRKHCTALKALCTDWPDGLTTQEDCDKHFPVQVTTRDYVVDSASIRDARARPVTIKVKLSALPLDYHARDKLIRLAGSRYEKHSDTLTIDADRCPLKKQNYDHGMYLLTAMYTEAWKTEAWEKEKTLADMEKYFWDLNPSKTTIVNTLRLLKEKSVSDEKSKGTTPVCLKSLPNSPSDDDIVRLKEVQEYKAAVTQLINDGEDVRSIEKYKNAVKKLLFNTDKT